MAARRRSHARARRRQKLARRRDGADQHAEGASREAREEPRGGEATDDGELSQLSELAKRLLAGRDPAELGPDSESARQLTRDDCSLLKDLLDLLLTAAQLGDPSVLDRLARARDLLLGKSDTKLDRLARYLKLIDGLTRAGRWHGDGPVRKHLPSYPLPKLLAFHDPAFANLSDAQIREALEAVPDERRQGRAGPLKAAALLAVRASAFGMGVRRRRDDDSAVSRSLQEKRALERATLELKKAQYQSLKK